MNILIVSQYYYPEQFQINEIAPELVKRGYMVTVVCGLPNYPKGEVFDGYGALEKREEIIQGVKVIRVNQVPRGKNVLKLIRNYESFARNSKKLIRKLPGDFDVVFGYQLSPISSMSAAIEYKKIHGTPIMFYTLDLWPVAVEGILKSKKNPFYFPISYLSKTIYQAADRILVTSRPFIDYLNRVNKTPRNKIGYLPQHADAEMLGIDISAEENDIADFMFAGNFGKGQRLDVIVNAAAELGARKDYRIHMVGDGSMRRVLEELVHKKGLQNNFIFYGNQKRTDMPSFYKKADALLISLRGNNEVGNTMPGKLQTYMTTGKPILGAINGAANEVIAEAECGKCVAAGDFKGLAVLMLDYIENPDKYAYCGKNAKRFFKDNFTLEKFIEGLESELVKLVNI